MVRASAAQSEGRGFEPRASHSKDLKNGTHCIIFCVFIAVNEVNSKNSLISRSLINIQGKILIFKEFQVPLPV